jgi:glycosyltransferase involved in cell wall biosynthesis
MQAIHDLGTPMVSTHHGIWLKEYLALDPSLIKTPIKYRKEMEKDTVRYADKNIFLSDLSLRVFEKELVKVPKNNLEKVKIPYNPVFLNKSYPKKSANKNISLLMVGRWDAVKNHEAYLALAKRIKERKLPWTINSVCKIGDYKHYDSIREEYGKYINVLPTTDAKGLKKYYQQASVVIVPSHFDVYPGVVTESLLQNRPALISPNVGWIDEYERHGLESWIMEFKDMDKVIDRIKKMSKQQVPKSLYNEVVTENNPKYVLKKYFEIFEEAAKLPGNK